jgi:hypothetical protein
MVTSTSPKSTNGMFLPGLQEFDDPGPDLTDILALKTDSEQYYRDFHKNCEEARDWFFGLVPSPTPEGFEEVTTAKARAMINVASDHVDVNNVSIDVPAASPRAKARAERLKKFYQGAWMNIRTQVKRDVTKACFAYGVGIFKTVFEPSLWPDQPPTLEESANEDAYKEALADFMDKRGISFPMEVLSVDPRNMLWDDSLTGPHWAIEYYERSDAETIRHRYANWSSAKRNGQPVSWFEYWDEEWAIYVADGEEVWRGRHGYGFQPYDFAIPANSISSSSGPPEERYQGILHGVRGLLKTRGRLLNAYEAILRQSAWPTLNFSGPVHLVEEAKRNYNIFGGMNSLPAGVTVNISPTPVPPQEILQSLTIVDNEIEEASFPNVVRGIRPKGISSGFGVSVLAGMGRLVFQGTADGLAMAIEKVNVKFAKLVENKIRGRVTVHARSDVHNFDQTIGPDDVRGYYENIVVLKAEAPEEREREALLAFRLWNGGNGIISMYEAQKRSGVVNPLEEQLQMGAEKILASPEIQQQQVQLATEGVGLLNQLAQTAQTGGGGGIGNQFLPGQAQLQRPGEGNIQQARIASQQGGGVFPQGLGGIASLGSRAGQPGGGAVGLPSGGTA